MWNKLKNISPWFYQSNFLATATIALPETLSLAKMYNRFYLEEYFYLIAAFKMCVSVGGHPSS